MATFATIPLDFITGGWLEDVSEAGYKLIVKSLALPLREDRIVRHCCTQVQLKRGEWLMSKNKMQEAVGIANDRTFDRALSELGPEGVGFLKWRQPCEHGGRKSKTVWSIARPDLFVRTADDVEAEKNSGIGLTLWQPTATTLPASMATVGHHKTRQSGGQMHPLHTRARTGAGAGDREGRAAAHARNLAHAPEALPPAQPPSEAAPFLSFSDTQESTFASAEDLDQAGLEARKLALIEHLSRDGGRNGTG